MHAHPLSHLWLFATPRTEALQTSLSMGFLRQEYWSGLPFPSPGDLPNPGIKPLSPVPPALWVDSLWLSHLGSLILHIYIYTLLTTIRQFFSLHTRCPPCLISWHACAMLISIYLPLLLHIYPLCSGMPYPHLSTHLLSAYCVPSFKN